MLHVQPDVHEAGRLHRSHGELQGEDTLNQLPLFENRKRFEAFKKFHAANPEVFVLFRRFARQAKDKGGRKYFGARMIAERIRWYTAVETNSDEEFKLCNNHIPYYARLLMLKYTEFDGFFARRDGQFDVGDEELRMVEVVR